MNNLTLLGQMITFIIFVLITMKFICPPLFKTLELRKKNISEGIKKAHKANILLNTSILKKQQIIQDAHNKAKIITEDAKKKENIIRKNIIDKTLEEQKQIIHESIKIMEIERNKIKEQLIQEIKDMIVECSSELIKRRLTIQDNEKLISEYIENLQIKKNKKNVI